MDASLPRFRLDDPLSAPAPAPQQDAGPASVYDESLVLGAELLERPHRGGGRKFFPTLWCWVARLKNF